MDGAIFKSKLTYFILLMYILLVVWWLKINFINTGQSTENYYYGLSYSFIAFIGGINGLIVAQKWGGFKSLFGRGISFLSLGLLSYWFGQVAWSYYNIVLRVEVPYPSIADIGYFSAIVFYALGMWSFAKTAGVKTSLQTLSGKLIAFIIPAFMLGLSYYFFLRETSPDLANPIRTFLDYGTPLGYAISFSIALIAYSLTRNVLGGRMKPKILYIIFAFIIQYITDYTFLYQFATESYINAGTNDLMFTTSFTIMAIGLIAFKDYE